MYLNPRLVANNMNILKYKTLADIYSNDIFSIAIHLLSMCFELQIMKLILKIKLTVS